MSGGLFVTNTGKFWKKTRSLCIFIGKELWPQTHSMLSKSFNMLTGPQILLLEHSLESQTCDRLQIPRCVALVFNCIVQCSQYVVLK